MIKNYLILAYRNFARNKKFLCINVLGFSLGITACLLIFTYIYNETNGYDKNFHDSECIYRVVTKAIINGKETVFPYSFGDLAPEIEQNLTGIENAFRIHHYGNLELEYKSFKSSALNIQYVDSTFFDFYNTQIEILGVENELLSPFSIVLSEQTAIRIFGNEDPYLKIVKIDGLNYTVKGVINTKVNKSHIQFDLLASMSSLIRPDYNIIELEGIHFPTYIKLNKEVSINKITDEINKINDEIVKEKLGVYGIEVEVFLQALDEIHLFSDFNPEYAKTTNVKFIYLFTALAIFILIIAVINFINLSIAIYHKRIKEVGLRKVIGAKRKDLIIQFVTESIIITFLAFILSLIFVEILANPFRNIIQADIQLVYYQSKIVLTFLILIVVCVGILSGLYPAWYLSGLKITSALKGVNKAKKYNHRKLLVVFQFAISVFIITVLLLLSGQMRYLQNKDMNFDSTNIIVLRDLSEKIISDYTVVKSELMKTPGVLSVTASTSTPGVNRISNDFIYVSGQDPNSGVLFNFNNVYYDYTKTYNIKLNRGRDFNQDFISDKDGAIINDFAAKKLNLSNPVGELIHVRGQDTKIIGVVNDYNFRSLHTPVEPLILYMRHKYFNFISIKIDPNNPAVQSNIRQTISEIDPDYEFNYFYEDETLRSLYNDEYQVYKLFSYAAILAIVISLLGLFALTLFTMQDKLKAIGIRKVLGASNKIVVVILLTDITKWVLVANVFAWPFAYYYMDKWLQKFSYKINIYEYWWCYLLAGIVALFLAIVITLNQTLKAANTNPVNILKCE